jgi:DNA-binding NtrC family response regulator
MSISLGLKPFKLPDSELDLLTQYEWPGNVRELKNVIERSLLLSAMPSECIPGMRSEPEPVNQPVTRSVLLEDVEKAHILKILDKEGGNKSAAARVLGISRKTLERKVNAWNRGA